MTFKCIDSVYCMNLPFLNLIPPYLWYKVCHTWNIWFQEIGKANLSLSLEFQSYSSHIKCRVILRLQFISTDLVLLALCILSCFCCRQVKPQVFYTWVGISYRINVRTYWITRLYWFGMCTCVLQNFRFFELWYGMSISRFQ